ncbi:hypothetical protein [Methanobrevibacter sp.]|uniref:hypothetical protein n=1 Tax=Methanobrevibacter sp. TaxID=66852 RepID=UPI0038651EA2
MNYLEFSKLMIMHFAIAVAITFMVVFVLSTVKIDNIAYLGVLFGMLVFAYFGVNRACEEKLIEDNYQKIILTIVCIVIFYLFLVYLMPMVFDMSCFGAIRIGGIVLKAKKIFIIMSIIVLILSCR